MRAPVVTVGHRFRGICRQCRMEVEGTMVEGEAGRTIEGKEICVTGSRGVGDCGHECISIGRSEVWRINGKPVARVGDPVTDGIDGELITGWDFVQAE